MHEHIELKVHLAFDDEAEIWYVAKSDIPGLRLEASDPLELVRRISETAGELVELNEGEVLRKQAGRPTVRFTPVFDSSLPVAAQA